MNILYSSDDKYSPFTGISITSLFENNKNLSEINVYIIGLRISEDNLSKFRELSNQYGRSITVIDASEIDKYLDDIGALQWRGNKGTWYRLFVQKYLDEHIDKILYIDGDTLILNSLSELDEFVFDNDKALAMVRWPHFKGYNKYIGMQGNSSYYNAGVIFFSMAKWRALKCNERIMSAIEKGYVDFMFLDQDLLCYALEDSIQSLPAKYNVLSMWVEFGINNLHIIRRDNDERRFYPLALVEDAVKNPTILHLTEGNTAQVWVEGNKNPYKEKWLKYKAMSPWKNIQPLKANKTFIKKIRNIMYSALPKALYCHINIGFEVWKTKQHYRKYGHFQ
ncbi:MAG: glycosyltransferase family 8 protein [Oscillospiraceae bacterium]|nr:glycosyltransferase family 8 protein [Oscillospiraceae bacterium]